jgi:ubiquinone biosynthesis protein Coq4
MYKLIVATRSRMLVFLTHHLALPVLKIIRKPQVFPYTAAQLQSFPDGTLGKDLIGLLEKNRFQLLTHYAKHDMKHILLGYATTDEGEVCLQAFMLGNGHVSFPVVSTILFGLFTMPEYWKSFIRAFKKGRRCAPVSDWNWFSIVHENTDVLRRKIFNS